MLSLWKHMSHLFSPYWTVYSSTGLQTASSFSLLPTHLIVKGTILCLGRIQMHKKKKELRICRPMSDVFHLLIDWVYTPFLRYVNVLVDFIKHYNGWQRSPLQLCEWEKCQREYQKWNCWNSHSFANKTGWNIFRNFDSTGVMGPRFVCLFKLVDFRCLGSKIVATFGLTWYRQTNTMKILIVYRYIFKRQYNNKNNNIE